MNERDRETYNLLLQRILQTFVRDDLYSYDELKENAKEICEFFQISKVVVEFYRSQSHEKMHDGDVYVTYDNAKKGKEVLKARLVTKTTAVAIGTLFAPENVEYSAEQLEKLELLLRVVLFFVSRKKLQYALERIAYFDEYGYPNIRSFLRSLDNSYRDEGLSIYTTICYDIKHLGLINKDIGHENGSKIMKMIYDMMEAMVGEGGIVCRFSGDIFMAKLRNENLKPILNILKGTSITYDGETQRKVMVSACVGIYKIPKDFSMVSSAEIVDKLLPAVNSAKQNENGDFVYFNDDVIHDKEEQMNLHRLFPVALSNHEFQVYYQPKIDVENGNKIIGAEALCRWLRDGRIVSPGEFIPILEQNSDICQLDFYILDKVCKDIKRWEEQGKKPVRISVNFSRKHMIDPNFMEKIIQIIRDNHVDPKYIEAELTETTTDVEFHDLKRVVGGLQKEGICTSVDDFGMGYSSLNLIREIPWDVLKIDKSFLPVEGESYNETTSLMYKYIISMANAMGLECITEGVETKDQIDILRENGCQFAQGYFFDKPLPVQDFEKRLEKGFYDTNE